MKGCIWVMAGDCGPIGGISGRQAGGSIGWQAGGKGMDMPPKDVPPKDDPRATATLDPKAMPSITPSAASKARAWA